MLHTWRNLPLTGSGWGSCASRTSGHVMANASMGQDEAIDAIWIVSDEALR